MHELAVAYADAARTDLDDILTHIFAETGNIDLALAYVGRIEARCERIGHVPTGGTPRDAIVPDCGSLISNDAPLSRTSLKTMWS